MNQKLVKDKHGNYVWLDARKAASAPMRAAPAPVDGSATGALGCTAGQLQQFQADAQLNGFKSIEFREDKDVKGWYNCWAPDSKTWDRYAHHCGQFNKSGQHAGKTITPEELEAAKRLANRNNLGKK